MSFRSRLLRSLVPFLLAGPLAACDLSNFLPDNAATSPSPAGPVTLDGTWLSVSSVTALTETCTNFVWNVTDLTTEHVGGTFTATCRTNLQIAGTAGGSRSGDSITWTATTMAAAPADCAVSLSGTATVEERQVRVPYTGTTCQGPVSGTEILRKN